MSSAPNLFFDERTTHYEPSSSGLKEPVLELTQRVWDSIKGLNNTPHEDKPTIENLHWAETVLLGGSILPRLYLSGAEIEAFAGEIHVTWELNNKKVIAFLPSDHQLRIYWEERVGPSIIDHIHPAENPSELRDKLDWLFA
jgi:hypothetical protein